MKANNDCVVAAVFADYANVRTRGVVKLIFEVPEHEATEAFRRLGGMPQSKSSKWCAIGLLDPVLFEDKKEKTAAVEAGPPTPPAPVEKERRPFHTLPRSQQAAMLARDERFARWWRDGLHAPGPSLDAALKIEFGILSKRELDAPGRLAQDWDNFVMVYFHQAGQTTWERPS